MSLSPTSPAATASSADAAPRFTDSAAPAIELRGVRLTYPNQARPAIDIEHLVVARGERVAVIGPSGGGKTTLLGVLNGLRQPDRGEVTILGQTVRAGHRRDRAQRRRVGTIFQDFALVERASVLDNVLWGRLGHAHPWLSLIGRFSPADREKAEAAVREVGLVEQRHQRADRLSGGQRQRVAIARVLAQEPELVLADEPVSNLDPALTDDVLGLLLEASQRRGATLVITLHQPQLAVGHADRVLGISAGRIVFDGRADGLSPAVLEDIYGHAFAVKSRTGSP